MAATGKRLLGRTVWRRRGAAAAAVVAVALASPIPARAGFLSPEIIHRGYIFDAQTLQQVHVGTPAQQVLIVLGTPSTTSTVGGDAWYYISQKAERRFPFMPLKIVKQRVYAVYFDKSKKVTRIANYGLKDGRVVDFSSDKTRAAGGDSHFLKSLFSEMGRLKYKL